MTYILLLFRREWHKYLGRRSVLHPWTKQYNIIFPAFPLPCSFASQCMCTLSSQKIQTGAYELKVTFLFRKKLLLLYYLLKETLTCQSQSHAVMTKPMEYRCLVCSSFNKGLPVMGQDTHLCVVGTPFLFLGRLGVDLDIAYASKRCYFDVMHLALCKRCTTTT
jgi:hypothetical protein